MSNFDYDLGVIGGGAAGLTAAAGAARFGAKTILIERSGKLGGDCLHYGCVPSKTLIRTAGLWAQVKRLRTFGLPELSLPAVNLGAVMDRVRSVIETIQQHDSEERFCDLGVAVRFGRCRFSDDHTVILDEERITARSWIIATGSSPVIPSLEGLSSVPYLTNETVFAQRDLPARLVVLGGGPVGLEIAQAFARLGSRVTVLEFMDQILGPEDADMAAFVQDRMQADGVEIHTGTRAVRAAANGAAIDLTVAPAGGGEPAVISGDALFVAVGRKPNLDGLEPEKAGIEIGLRGIPVDGRMKTNVKHIYACGDVNGLLPFTHAAGYQAGIALTNAVLRLPRHGDHRKIGWCTYTDPEVASIGLNEKRAKKEGIDYRLLEEPFSGNDRALAEGETSGKIKILVDPRGKLLGCQIVGARAGEIIHEWVLAVSGGLGLSKMAEAVHIYPTLSEISKRAAGQYYADKLFSDRTRGILRFLFQLKGRACRPPEGSGTSDTDKTVSST
jgi:pyruvate/2-oxoglutarate dehydrogenase complex dihydrolipoamide dehydrogenase (E3) component